MHLKRLSVDLSSETHDAIAWADRSQAKWGRLPGIPSSAPAYCRRRPVIWQQTAKPGLQKSLEQPGRLLSWAQTAKNNL